MSIKTIAVDAKVYERLTRLKREDESYSKAMDRLMMQAAGNKTGAAIHDRLSSLRATPLTDREAGAMHKVVEGHRRKESWPHHDMR
ncbi:MAG TPA: antitoxin VapB family protein [Kiritimatiellia bacterium]|nr:antitoxin VapB family protein [Kiritimatiellia bacterium]HMP34219.1 antitoxin VapB family protein [Kiritimatiellia bacterium]